MSIPLQSITSGFGGGTSGFRNPPVTVDGVIARPQFESNNYVPGVSGWAIYQNGDAEFNDLTIRGQFVGTDFIINSDGIFFYD